jgi:hypothetical protein
MLADDDAVISKFLSDNVKLAKDHPGLTARLQGLSLLPADYFALRGGEGMNELHGAGTISAAEAIGPQAGMRRRFTLCAGSNLQCRKSCLVFSGANELDVFSRRKKEAMVAMLLMDPVAFCRVLVESLVRFGGTWLRPGARSRSQPFTRLNVYSDIPWELVCPSIFREAGNVSFYDYTKLPGRPEVCRDLLADEAGRRGGVDVADFPTNYHLTFSASGDNDTKCFYEMTRGRKIAVVFESTEHRVPALYRPSFWPEDVMFPVIPGDVHDVRPADPSLEAMQTALKQVGMPQAWWTETRLKAYQSWLTAVAYEYTYGRSGYPEDPARAPATGTGIVGLYHKPPSREQPRAKQRVALQVVGKRPPGEGARGTRLFLVPVKIKGDQIIAEGCPTTPAVMKALVPADQPLILRITQQATGKVPEAARRKPRK